MSVNHTYTAAGGEHPECCLPVLCLLEDRWEQHWAHLAGTPCLEPNFLAQLSPSPKPKHKPQGPTLSQFSLPKTTSVMCVPIFPKQIENPSSSSNPPSISLLSPPPSNILVTSSHRGAPSLAFSGWCNFTHVLASVGRVIRSCCSMMMPPDWPCPLLVRKRPEPLLRCLTVAWSSSDHSLLPSGFLCVPAAPEPRSSWKLMWLSQLWKTYSSLKLGPACLRGGWLSRSESMPLHILLEEQKAGRRDPENRSYRQNSRTCRNILKTAKYPKTKI